MKYYVGRDAQLTAGELCAALGSEAKNHYLLQPTVETTSKKA